MTKHLCYTFLLTFLTCLLHAQTVSINDAEGWFESAYITWTPVDDADSYNVYYSGEGITNEQIDDELIRCYGTYYRADVLGLAAGTYTIKVVPVFSDGEGTSTTSSSITVSEYDRSGFAFTDDHVPGAYESDGTLKDDAVVIYITENTKDDVELEVTGASDSPCVGLQAILDGFKKGKDDRPLVIRMVGQITDLDDMSKGDIVIENNNNEDGFITMEGVGNDAVADGWGVRLKNASNVEVRNIGCMNCDSDEGDDIGLQQGNEYVWVHNCDFFYGDAGGDSDQAKGDGSLDCKKSTYITFSYNHFWDSGKCCLLGLSENTTEGLYITYHHNWFDHSDSRHPRVRYYSAHVYNNYYDGNSKYGVGSTEGSSVFVEANYFRHCKYPMMISMQGTDVYGDNEGTFSDEDGGIIKAYNNTIIDATDFIAYGDDDYTDIDTEEQFDAYVVTSRNTSVPSSVTSYQGDNIYNNFDTDDDIMYDYTADSPSTAKSNVEEYAGRMFGGDFTWDFDDDEDDESHDVDDDLKDALTSYETSLVSIQGEGESSDSSDDNSDDDSSEVVEGDEVHNFTESGLSSSFYTISGNLSTSKGTVTYGDLTLTTCLKIESSTSITFTTTASSTLTLVFNDDFDGDIKIDDTSYTASDGILTVSLDAGSHEITKDDSCNLYYMSVIYDDDEEDDSDDSSDDSSDDEEGTITASAVAGDAYVTLSWTTENIDIRNIQIYRDTDSDPDGRTRISSSSDVEETSYTDSDVSNGTTYYYWVKIVDTDLESYNSDAVEATPESVSASSNYSLFDDPTETVDTETIELCIYPNPVIDRLYINYDDNINVVTVYNITGTVVKKVYNVESYLDMADLESGVYVIIFNSSDEKIVRRVIKQ